MAAFGPHSFLSHNLLNNCIDSVGCVWRAWAHGYVFRLSPPLPPCFCESFWNCCRNSSPRRRPASHRIVEWVVALVLNMLVLKRWPQSMFRKKNLRISGASCFSSGALTLRSACWGERGLQHPGSSAGSSSVGGLRPWAELVKDTASYQPGALCVPSFNPHEDLGREDGALPAQMRRALHEVGQSGSMSLGWKAQESHVGLDKCLVYPSPRRVTQPPACSHPRHGLWMAEFRPMVPKNQSSGKWQSVKRFSLTSGKVKQGQCSKLSMKLVVFSFGKGCLLSSETLSSLRSKYPLLHMVSLILNGRSLVNI